MPEEQQPHTHAQTHHAHGHISDFRPQYTQSTHRPVHAQTHAAPVHHAAQPQHAVHHTPPQPPAEPTAKNAFHNSSILQPTPVVKMWSTRGLEYAMMAISLWISAAALAWLLISLIYDRNSFVALVSPVSALAVCVPVLTFFFIRLKMAEANNPMLRADPSRRRWTQITQYIAYIAVLLGLIGLVHELLTRYGTDMAYSRPFSKIILGFVTVISIALIILIYYWADEHRPIKR